MEKVLLITCKICGKIHKHENWIFLNQEERTILFLNYRVEILKGICPSCYEARQLAATLAAQTKLGPATAGPK